MIEFTTSLTLITSQIHRIFSEYNYFLLEKQNYLEFSPGTKYNYSNSNYNILAKIIEKVSEQKFTEYSKNFFLDLNMLELMVLLFRPPDYL